MLPYSFGGSVSFARMSTYSERLADPRWQRRRLELYQRDNFECQHCSRGDQQLEIHHAYYVSGRSPWHYPGASLRTLCNGCHKIQQSVGPSAVFAWEVLAGLGMTENVNAMGMVRLLEQARRKSGLSLEAIWDGLIKAIEHDQIDLIQLCAQTSSIRHGKR